MRGYRTLAFLLAILIAHSWGRLVIDGYVFIVFVVVFFFLLFLDSIELGVQTIKPTK